MAKKSAVMSREDIVVQNANNFADVMRQYVGTKVVLICARYQYWGVVSLVTDDSLILANPVAVEASGSAQDNNPATIDPIGTSIVIKHDAIEVVYRPKWVDNALPGE